MLILYLVVEFSHGSLQAALLLQQPLEFFQFKLLLNTFDSTLSVADQNPDFLCIVCALAHFVADFVLFPLLVVDRVTNFIHINIAHRECRLDAFVWISLLQDAEHIVNSFNIDCAYELLFGSWELHILQTEFNCSDEMVFQGLVLFDAVDNLYHDIRANVPL